MSNKLISILTPTYNRADTYLEQTIKSVQNQKEVGFTHEHVIVDNASSDGTAKLVKAMAKKDKRIKYVHSKENLGAAGGLNLAFKHSKGGLIVPLDDDDMLPLSSLQFRYNYFQANPKVKWAYGYSLFIRHDNQLTDELVEYYVQYKPQKTDLLSLLQRCFIPNGTVTVKRESIKAVGAWTQGIKTQDYDLWLKLASAKIKPYLMDSYLCLYRLHPGQVSRIQQEDGTYNAEKEYYESKYAKYRKLLKK